MAASRTPEAQAAYRRRKVGYAEMNRRHQAAHAAKHPDRKAARNSARYTKPKGLKTCPRCGAQITGSNKIELHHTGYGNSPKGITTCTSCHPNRGSGSRA